MVMKANRVGSLYILQGRIVTSSRASVISSSPNLEDDTTRLWHLTLGHMSEKGMTLLSERGFLNG